MAVKTLRGRGLRVELDTAEIIPEDPGAGTPACIYDEADEENNGTYLCALDTGEFSSTGAKLSATQYAWLQSIEPKVEEFLSTAREG